MAEFVQIGNRAFNPEHITEVWFTEGREASVYFVSVELVNPTTFIGDEYDAFCKWWSEQANVYKVT